MRYLKQIIVTILLSVTLSAQTYTDKPFIQDYADKFEIGSHQNDIRLMQVRSDRNNIINVLSSNGLLQPWEDDLVADVRYRPLTDSKIIALDRYEDQFVYLTDKAVLSNSWAGKFYVEHGLKNPTQFVVAHDFTTLVAAEGELQLIQNGKLTWNESADNFNPKKIFFDMSGKRFLILTTDAVYQLKCHEKILSKVYPGKNLTAITVKDDKIILGTNNGILSLDGKTFKAGEINQKLPWVEITAVENVDGTLWFGSTKGAFKLREDGKYDYYASKRWLVDDEVIDISKGPENSILVLTKKGLSKINFVEMTLAEKAEYFQKIQRLRHIRYGLSSEINLTVPGDLSTVVLRDDDNDGLWTSMYLAGELFRYLVTKSEDAKQNAYEAFESMERLTEISGISGFPARTYEIASYVASDLDPNKWPLAKDKRWRWKSTTSSDESAGHFFVYALLAELAPDKEWRNRAIHQIKIEMDHIIDNDWYLVTWTGKPTSWGKWNPDYVNKYPVFVGDRRLSSTVILAFLQTAYHFTGDEKYKEKAYELIDEHGYDINANRLATVIGYDESVRADNGDPLSNNWNHSDDEMYFLSIPAFVKYAFNDEQKQKHFATIKSHWEIERSEKNPLWNYLYALSGGKDYDRSESIWWLKEFSMDLIGWDVSNSHRKDLNKLKHNFRRQEYTEVLPQDERPMHLHNKAYWNNNSEGGSKEYPPYIYLLPYWAGRYVGAIGPAE